MAVRLNDFENFTTILRISSAIVPRKRRLLDS